MVLPRRRSQPSLSLYFSLSFSPSLSLLSLSLLFSLSPFTFHSRSHYTNNISITVAVIAIYFSCCYYYWSFNCFHFNSESLRYTLYATFEYIFTSNVVGEPHVLLHQSCLRINECSLGKYNKNASAGFGRARGASLKVRGGGGGGGGGLKTPFSQ